ncbi:MAG: AraC family transcriptional regulator [Cyclobacteriaceae bacterium]
MNIYSKKVSELNEANFRNKYQIDRVISAKNYIDKNYAENFSLDMIANAVHSSKFHLNREFKRLYGMTPSKYLIEKRIQEAKKILTNNGTVSDACFSVGYESLSTFSILFRRMTGKNAESFKSARMKK